MNQVDWQAGVELEGRVATSELQVEATWEHCLRATVVSGAMLLAFGTLLSAVCKKNAIVSSQTQH